MEIIQGKMQEMDLKNGYVINIYFRIQNLCLINYYLILQGGYMGAKKAKLDQQINHKNGIEEAGALGSGIFNGISIYINGYTGNFICL